MLSGRKIRERLFTGLLLGALSLTSMPGGAVDYYLAAKQFNMLMPGGTTSVPMWGYVADPGGACYNASSDAARLTCVNGLAAPTVPGPRLTVGPADNALQIFLSNGLSVPTSIVIPGAEMPFSNSSNGPTWGDGSVGARPSVSARVRSFGREAAANGGREQYLWNGAQSNPFQVGTYTYQSGTHPQVQVQMGLYGAVSRDAAANEAYAGVTYNAARDLFYSEVDPALHQAVATGTYGTTGPTSTLNYQPKYFLLQTYNGGGLPVDVTIGPSIGTCPSSLSASLAAGNRVLLRMYNAGLRELAPMMIGSHFDLVAEGGKKAPFAQRQYQVMLLPGSTRDVIFTPGYEGKFPLIERRLNLTDNAQMNGGMQTCLQVGAGGGNEPPIITSTPVTTATVGQPYSYDVNATDPNAGSTLTYSLDVNPTGMTINSGTGLISWTPAAGQVGPNNVTVRVTDNGSPSMFTTQSFTITVAAPNNPPTITSVPGTTATAGLAYSYDVNATDPNGNTLTYSLDVAPAGMSINSATGLIAWTPTAGQAGPNNVTVRVTDNGVPPLSATQSFTITVTAPNHAPTITSTPVTTATVGLAYSYDVNATDPDTGNTLTYSLDVAPAGMSINSGTGLIAWTPAAGQVGPNSVTVRATDNGAPPMFATQSFTVTVAPPPTKHVGDLDASAGNVNANTWQATVTITVHNQNHNPVQGAVVSRTWNPAGSGGGANNTATCTTNAVGQCLLSRRFSRASVPSATLTVTNLTGAGGTYQAAGNHDPDGDSNGTSITIARP